MFLGALIQCSIDRLAIVLILLPVSLGCFNILFLGGLLASTEQDHNMIGLFSKIDPVSGTKHIGNSFIS